MCDPRIPPQTKIKDVVAEFHGTTVHDPYRWLENWDNPEVREWSRQQNRYARAYLNAIPGIESLEKRVEKIMTAQSTSYYYIQYRTGTFFAMKKQPPLDQPLLVTLPAAETTKEETVILDLNKFDPEGRTSIDWYTPSWDAKLVAVSLSKGGSESGDLHVFNTATGQQTDMVIRKVNGGTAGGDLAWRPDNSGFYYTRYPRRGERPEKDLSFYQEIWFHQLGTPETADRYVIGKKFDRIAEIRLEIDPRSGQLLVSVQHGDSGRFQHFLKNESGEWQQITTYDDQVIEARFGLNNELFLISVNQAPRGKILRLPVNAPRLDKAQVLIPQKEHTIVSSFYDKSQLIPAENRLYVTYQLGGPSEIQVFDLTGKPQPGPEMLPVSSIYELTALTKDQILFNNGSYLKPPAWYRFDPHRERTQKTALATESPIDFSDAEVVREYASSKDGTQIPVNIIRPKNIKLDGANPVLLNGYGGFGVSKSPGFRAINRIWLDHGGVYAVANIRGGGEFGEEWHRAGSLSNKQNCFDDFAAAMQHMISSGYTTPQQLALIGGSNGGLLMGAMLTQHPSRFSATVSSVGIYDMIRSELTPNGSFNIPEYGTVENPQQFKAMYAYSPYHNVEDNVEYPAVLFMTGANDPRVDPMHSRKITARLQAANRSENPILLRTSAETGHGYGTPLEDRIAEYTHIYGFLLHELNISLQEE